MVNLKKKQIVMYADKPLIRLVFIGSFKSFEVILGLR